MAVLAGKIALENAIGISGGKIDPRCGRNASDGGSGYASAFSWGPSWYSSSRGGARTAIPTSFRISFIRSMPGSAIRRCQVRFRFRRRQDSLAQMQAEARHPRVSRLGWEQPAPRRIRGIATTVWRNPRIRMPRPSPTTPAPSTVMTASRARTLPSHHRDRSPAIGIKSPRRNRPTRDRGRARPHLRAIRSHNLRGQIHPPLARVTSIQRTRNRSAQGTGDDAYRACIDVGPSSRSSA